jgi:hypothetical protein
LERWSVTGPVTALKKIRDRGQALVSVHRHNDRGTAVAAAELAVMADADHGEWRRCSMASAVAAAADRLRPDCAAFTVRLCSFHHLVGDYPPTWTKNLMERFQN